MVQQILKMQLEFKLIPEPLFADIGLTFGVIFGNIFGPTWGQKLDFLFDGIWKALWAVSGMPLGSHGGLFGGSMFKIYCQKIIRNVFCENEHVRSVICLGPIFGAKIGSFPVIVEPKNWPGPKKLHLLDRFRSRFETQSGTQNGPKTGPQMEPKTIRPAPHPKGGCE